MDYAARSHLRRLSALSDASRNRAERRRHGSAMPQPTAEPPASTPVCRACVWPMWPDDQPPPRPALFCGSAEIVPGTPYCAAHGARAFTQPKEQA